MTDWARHRVVPGQGEGDDWERYLDSCTDYIRRQVLIYKNWPQRRFGAMGYSREKVFTDMNA